MSCHFLSIQYTYIIEENFLSQVEDKFCFLKKKRLIFKFEKVLSNSQSVENSWQKKM